MVVRELEPDEYWRLEGHEFLKQVPSQENSKILIAEVEDRIVGFWMVVGVIHIEPVWIAPEYRGTTVSGRMWRGVKRLLDALHIPVAFCYSQRPDTSDYLTRLGLRELPYKTFLYDPQGIYPKEP